MTTNKVVKAVKMDSKLVKFSENIKTNKYNGKSIYVNYNNGPMRLQMPKTNLPFGISKYINPDKPEEIKYSLEMSFKGVDPVVLKQLKDIEKAALEFVQKNSKELFKKQMSMEVLKENYKSSIKYSETEDGTIDDKYAPRLKAKIYTEGSSLNVDTYDSEKVNGTYPKINLNEENVDEIITKGSSCETILSCSGIWVVGKTFGISWVLSQLKIYKNENSLNGYAFDEDDEEEGVQEDEIEEENPFEEDLKITENVKKPRRQREVF